MRYEVEYNHHVFFTFTQKCYNEVITRPALLRKYKNFRRVPCAKSLRIPFDVVSARRPTAKQNSLSFPNWSVWFLWRICNFLSMYHALCCTDECDMVGKTFVDLGSGVGQVLWWHDLCVALSQHSLGCQDYLTSIIGRSAWWSLHCPAHAGVLFWSRQRPCLVSSDFMCSQS